MERLQSLRNNIAEKPNNRLVYSFNGLIGLYIFMFYTIFMVNIVATRKRVVFTMDERGQANIFNPPAPPISVDELFQELNGLLEELDNVQDRITENARERLNLEGVIERLRNLEAPDFEAIDALNEQLDSLQAEAEELQRRVADLENKIAELRKRIQVVKMEEGQYKVDEYTLTNSMRVAFIVAFIVIFFQLVVNFIYGSYVLKEKPKVASIFILFDLFALLFLFGLYTVFYNIMSTHSSENQEQKYIVRMDTNVVYIIYTSMIYLIVYTNIINQLRIFLSSKLLDRNDVGNKNFKIPKRSPTRSPYIQSASIRRNPSDMSSSFRRHSPLNLEPNPFDRASSFRRQSPLNMEPNPSDMSSSFQGSNPFDRASSFQGSNPFDRASSFRGPNPFVRTPSIWEQNPSYDDGYPYDIRSDPGVTRSFSLSPQEQNLVDRYRQFQSQ